MFDDEIEASIALQIQMKTYQELPRLRARGESSFHFLSDFKRHSPFDKASSESDTIEHFFDEHIVFKVSSTDYDMISDLFLRVDLPDISAYAARWTNTTGHAIIDHVSIMNNDQEIIRYTSEMLNIILQLDTNAGHYSGQCQMLNHKATETALSGQRQQLYIEIPFLKTNEDRQMFPVMLCKYGGFQVKVKFKSLTNSIFVEKESTVAINLVPTQTGLILVNLSTTVHPIIQSKYRVRLRSTLMFEGYHLTNEERYLFLNKTGDILFKRYQYLDVHISQGSTKVMVPLDFKGSISELLFTMHSKSLKNINRYYKYIQLENVELMLRSMHTNQIPAKIYLAGNSHKCAPSTFIYSLPFCLSATHTQPSGHVVFQGVKGRDALTLTFNRLSSDSVLSLTAVVYSKLTFTDGGIQVVDIE
jgi:hypothetical protein